MRYNEKEKEVLEQLKISHYIPAEIETAIRKYINGDQQAIFCQTDFFRWYVEAAPPLLSLKLLQLWQDKQLTNLAIEIGIGKEEDYQGPVKIIYNEDILAVFIKHMIAYGLITNNIKFIPNSAKHHKQLITGIYLTLVEYKFFKVTGNRKIAEDPVASELEIYKWFCKFFHIDEMQQRTRCPEICKRVVKEELPIFRLVLGKKEISSYTIATSIK